MRSVRLIARPLKEWPGELRHDDDRAFSPFSASWSQTTDLLDKEAYHLGAEEVVVQLALRERDFRLDGWIRADAKPSHPGVTLVLPESNQGRISFSTDRYRHGYRRGNRMDGWQANVRAIALSMEALRTADRHDVMQGAQYAGFKEIGSGLAMDAFANAEAAAAFICGLADIPPKHVMGEVQAILDSEEALDMLYRRAAKKAHPDAGGDATTFQKLQAAKALLDRQGA